MAHVPKKYPKEPGATHCGDSFKRSIVVTGEIPKLDGFGSEYTETIEPLTLYQDETDVRKNEKISNLVYEEEITKAIQRAIAETRDEIHKERARYSPGERKALEWLMDSAEAQLARIEEIHASWYNRTSGQWTLGHRDFVSHFPAAHDPTDCDKYGKWVPAAGSQTGRPGRGIDVQCPTKEEIERRPKDRATIRHRYQDALRHVRCAQYWLTRVRLYAKAKSNYRGPGPKRFATVAVSPPPPTPFGPGGFKAPPPAPPPPPVPPLGEAPPPVEPPGPPGPPEPPPELPHPIPEAPEPGLPDPGELPDAVGHPWDDPPTLPDAEIDAKEKDSLLRNPLVIALGILGVGFWLTKR